MNTSLSGTGRRLALAACCVMSCLASSAHAQGSAADYPNRSIKLIVPYSAAGLVDTFARYMAQYLTEKMGQSVIVENRPGANQAIGNSVAAKAAPDGYTILLGSETGLVLNTIVRKQLAYDPVRDSAPVSMLFMTPSYLVVNPSVPANTLKELIDLAKAKPGKLSYASIGQGSSQHLTMEMFKTRAKIDILHVPYKGSAESAIAVFTGQVNMAFEGGASALPYVRAGKFRALASTGSKRSELMPDLPTLSETFPGLDLSVWFGLFAPAGVPRPIIDKLNREIGEMLRLPATRERFAVYGSEMSPSTPEDLSARIRSELPRFTKIMRDAGIQPE